MCINMAKTIKEERLRWVSPIINKEIKLNDAVKVCPYSKRSLERWLAEYRQRGRSRSGTEINQTENQSERNSDKDKGKSDRIEKNMNLCALKLKWKLEKENIVLHKNTIQKIIKKEGLVRKYRIRKLKYKYLKVPLNKGELVEIDVKYVPETIENKQYYQFTAIDCASRWRYLKIYDNYANSDSTDFLEELIKIAPFRIRAIKTDNGSNFTNRYTGYLKSSDSFNPRLHALGYSLSKIQYHPLSH